MSRNTITRRAPRATSIESLEGRMLLAADLPAGFSESVYVAGFDTPTAQAFAPDGRLFVLEKAGKVRVVTAGGALNSTPFVSLNVDTAQDRGLVALAFDPNFQSNGFLYLWYSKTDSAGTRTRLSRFTASSSNANIAQPGSELVLLEVPHATNIHTGGAMGFGADGMLYLGVGDGGESFHAQDLSDLRGKVLRLNVSNPSNIVPANNPYVGVAGARPEIFARGLRNPFSGQVKPGTNTLYVSDVGQDAFEEVNVIQSGGNYGWPNAEGPSSNPAFINPLYSYSHAGFSSAAITGAAFYTGNQYPAEYQGSYFFADYLNGFMRRVDAAGNGQNFGTNVAGPLDIDQGPDGSLYYISAFGNGFNGTNRPIYKISYTAGVNRAPAAVAAATGATNGLTPLTVGFTGTGSSDPDGDPLTYAWNFGDNSTATGKDVSHAYTTNGTYFATLTVSDGKGGSNTSQPIRIDAGNRAPVGVIQTPASTLTYAANQTINFSGTASDPDEGALAASQFSWMVYLVHNTHEHQFAGPFDGVTSGSFFVPPNGHVENNHHYRIELTVTDSQGLATKTSREVFPQISTVTLASNIAGLSLALDGQPFATPFSSGSLVGATRALSAPATQTVNGSTYQFVSWSDGGAATHDVTIASTNRTYTATYQLAAPTQQALAATADSYVRSASSNTNYGTASSLYAKKSATDNRYTYFKFDTTAVTGSVASVKLRVFGKLETTGATGVLTEVFGTTTSWTETGIKWNNKPAATTAKLAGVTVAGTAGGWYELDVTAYVQAERAAGRNVIGLVLINPTNSTPAVVFNSRQNASNKPQLLVTTSVTPPPPSQTPFGGSPIAVPGTIEAENFDNGGEGVAYHDVTSANEGNNPGYRSSAVDLEIAGDTGGGANVGWVKAGEWLEYTLNVATAGNYTFDARVAMLGQGGSFSVQVDGALVTSFTVPDTGGYQNYKTISRSGVALPAGQHVLRITADTEGPSGFAGNINWVRFSDTPLATPPAAPSNLAASAPSSAQVNLVWSDNSNNETGFKVERKTGASGSWAQIATTTLAGYTDTTVAAGTQYVYRVRATNAAGDSAYSNEAPVTPPLPTSGQTPFGGTPWAISGIIEAENFDEGGEGVAYHDVDAAQQGGSYRTNVGVDVEPADDTGGGHNVGYIRAGEWLEYTVNVAVAGGYTFDVRVASGNPGGTFHIEFDGVNKSGAISLPYTGGWGNWQTVSTGLVNLAAGVQVMRIAIDGSNLAGADVGRINWIRVNPFSVANQTPYYGTPLPISGRIQAEDFDNGGEGVAYHDTTAANEANTGYRSSGVEIEATGDVGGGWNVGWMRNGEWLEYTINVASAGFYQLDVRVASQGAGGTLMFLFDGIDRSGNIPVPDTGGWQTYATLTTSVQLSAGVQVMRVLVTSEGASGFAGNLNYIDLTAAGSAQSQPLSAALLPALKPGS